MMHCDCSETSRCPEAHTLRDQYQAVRTIEARVEVSQRYTQHLYDAGLLAYPTTASPTWRCEEACAHGG